MRTRYLATALLSLTPAFAAAQGGSPLVGKWSIEYERGRRMENGTVTPMMGTGTLTIEPKGDSLVATLAVAGTRPDGSPVPPTVMGGKSTATGAVFVQKGIVTLNVNGEQRQVESVVTWTLAATGDDLRGTLLRELPGAVAQVPTEPAPVKGTRAR